jgi:uncharacterized protein YdaU (DUF1376 family)
LNDPLNPRAPAFQWYPSDFMADINVQLMDWTQRGIYVWLIGICWLDKSIPSDIGSLAKLTHIPVAWWEENGGRILACFKPLPGGKLYHPRIEKERAKQKAYREIKQRSGEIGAKNRWNKHNKAKELNSNAIVLPLANDSSSVFSLQSSSSDSTPKSPQGDLCEIGKRCNGKYKDCCREFDQFWVAYPRHDPPRKQAKKSWCTQFHAGLVLDDILDWIATAKERWLDKKYIPQPTTWINQRRWEGDLPPIPTISPKKELEDNFWDQMEDKYGEPSGD